MKRHLCSGGMPATFALLAGLVAQVSGAPQTGGQQASGAAPTLQEAVAALQRQDYAGAEQKLRAALRLHPNDAEALSMLGIALDQQKKFTEAAEFHKRAIANAPRSTAALYNYANHLLATGDEKGARDTLLKSNAVDPTDRSTNMALGQMALNRKDGREALKYLDRLTDSPETAILRLIALDLAGDRLEAEALFQRLASETESNGKLSSEDGWALAKAGQFGQAETFLTNALARDPGNFALLYALGVTASQAGHSDRARGLLESAHRQQADNVDVLYALAMVHKDLAQPEPAIRLLAEAAKLAPQRADVQKLIAVVARDMRADEDSVAAWKAYLKLMPGDDEARRELAFGKARIALLDEAIPELEAYIQRHPNDAVAFYELGMSQSVDDLAAAVQSLDRAIALKPDFVAARAGRGMLLYSQNRPEAALPDLQFAIDKLPADAPGRATLLDRLGQTFVALDRLKEAIQPLRKAAELSPDDSTTQLHLANALAEAGQTEESDALMAHFRQMRPGARAPKVTGVVDYLSMTPETRRALYQARLEKAVHDHPEEVNSQLLYLKFLLMNGKMTEAGETARKLAALRPGAVALAEAGHALLLAGAYSDAKELLAQAASADMSVGVTLDLAMASFHAAGAGTAAADEGLRQLDRIPEAARTAGYYLARAQMLDATGRPVEGIAEMDRALAAAPRDPDLYWQAAVMMLRGDRANDALRLLDGAEKALPQEAEIPVIRAAMLELAGKTDDARHVLNEAQRRWPEVAAVWTAQGIILAAHGQADEARTALETAVTLGAHSPETFYALAESSLRSGPRNIAAAEAAILEASRLAPDDVRTKALSARIAERRKGIAPTEGMAWREEALDPARLFEARPPREW